MKNLKLSFIFLSFIFVSGCFQTTALLGPSMTAVTTGNILQAGFQYGANTAIKNETGEYPLTHIKKKVEEKNNLKNFHVELKNFVGNKIEATKKKLPLN